MPIMRQRFLSEVAALTPSTAIMTKNGSALPAQDPNHLVSQSLPSTARKKLLVLQWKADGITTKISELRD